MEQKQKQKVTVVGWLSLIILVVLFSGVFAHSQNFLKAFDFGNLTGTFGHLGNLGDFHGKGGTGAREGMIYGLTLVPTVMLAVGLIDVVESLGGLRAAEHLFRPILRPLLGIPGEAGISFVASFTSSDVAAVMTKELTESGVMTDNERSVYVAYQYAGSALVMNTINTMAPLLPLAVVALGPVLLTLFILKIMGANILRVYLRFQAHKATAKATAKKPEEAYPNATELN